MIVEPGIKSRRWQKGERIKQAVMSGNAEERRNDAVGWAVGGS